MRLQFSRAREPLVVIFQHQCVPANVGGMIEPSKLGLGTPLLKTSFTTLRSKSRKHLTEPSFLDSL